jgi:TM2 domain-containing membrane protein YozV
MTKISRILVFTLLGFLSHPSSTMAQGKSGIAEIDSLPLYDWKTGSSPLSYTKAFTYSALLPGGGQIYGQHPVRGGFLIGLETVLVGLAAYSTFSDIPHWREQARDALDSADMLFQMQGRANADSAAKLERRRLEKIEFARQRTQLASQQQDLTRSQFAWAAGLHFYGVLDAMEIAYLSRHRDTKTRSPSKALYRGLIFPGGGQLYNRRFGKFGMLWMTLGASAVSAYSRQEMVSLLNDRLSVARLEAGSTGTSLTVKELEKDRTLYRKRRNQYFWGMSLFYVYAMLDGMVDAALADFDAPQHFALNLTPSGAIGAQLNLPF